VDFDIRLPIGLLFGALGALLIPYGLLSGPEIYRAHSLGLNINLIWGAVLLLFGLATLALSLMRTRSRQKGEGSQPGRPDATGVEDPHP
jgi:hypothetical protein